MRERWYKDTSDKLLFGVCAGLAPIIGLDKAWVRLAAVVALLLSPLTTAILYGVAVWLLPAKPHLEGQWERKP
ncbi:PspC domain-containing protein [Gallaecimonas pentaromativorans]|uniref:Phage shock protein C (PspC) family protein n=1 Tax=Gallaecimonas pentaromativorans TaxID=584787 RepID=A0A3N1PPV3_9GAMM|nr:PspC domain-containing protein [Gallaecimonas pentaromativorans]ROQ30533.1 phage shock protein C (PspC) family protein [Gallaecimonas pentaromativorans]